MKNYLTYGQVDSVCLKMAKLGENDLHPLMRQLIVNDKVGKIFRVLDGLNDPWYNRTAVLTSAGEVENLWDSTFADGVVTAVTTTTITRSSGAFGAGSLIAITDYDQSNGNSVQALCRITVGGATATFEVIAGTVIPFPVASHRVFVTVIPSLSSNAVDLSTMYVQKVLRVWDDGGTDTQDRNYDEFNDGMAFGLLWRNPFFDKRLCWYHRGDTLQIFQGKSADAYSVVQMEYRGKPALFTDATIANSVDIPPEDNQMLLDEVTAEYIRRSGGTVPPELLSSLEMYKQSAAQAKGGEDIKEAQKATKQ